MQISRCSLRGHTHLPSRFKTSNNLALDNLGNRRISSNLSSRLDISAKMAICAYLYCTWVDGADLSSRLLPQWRYRSIYSDSCWWGSLFSGRSHLRAEKAQLLNQLVWLSRTLSRDDSCSLYLSLCSGSASCLSGELERLVLKPVQNHLDIFD